MRKWTKNEIEKCVGASVKESDDQQKVRIKFTLKMKRLNKTSNVRPNLIFPKDVAAVVTSVFPREDTISAVS